MTDSVFLQTCPRCGVDFTVEERGLDDEHCQVCWEAICSEGWWEMTNESSLLAMVKLPHPPLYKPNAWELYDAMQAAELARKISVFQQLNYRIDFLERLTGRTEGSIVVLPRKEGGASL